MRLNLFRDRVFADDTTDKIVCWRRGSFLVRENAFRKLQIPQCRACHFCQGCQDSLHYLALRFCFFTRAVLRNALDSISVLIVKRAVGALQLEWRQLLPFAQEVKLWFPDLNARQDRGRLLRRY